MNKLSRKTIETLLIGEAKLRNIKLNQFGFFNIVEELLEYQEEGRCPIDQVYYILDKSIPDGSRDECLDN